MPFSSGTGGESRVSSLVFPVYCSFLTAAYDRITPSARTSINFHQFHWPSATKPPRAGTFGGWGWGGCFRWFFEPSPGWPGPRCHRGHRGAFWARCEALRWRLFGTRNRFLLMLSMLAAGVVLMLRCHGGCCCFKVLWDCREHSSSRPDLPAEPSSSFHSSASAHMHMYVYRLPVILSLSVCLYVYVCVNVCVCSFDPMYACLYDVCMNGCMMSVCLSVCLSVCPSFCRSVIGMYACLSIELSSQLAALKFFAPS